MVSFVKVKVCRQMRPTMTGNTTKYMVYIVKVKVGRQMRPFGQVMSPHHSDLMSERSQVPRIAPLGSSLMEVHRLVGR